MTDTNRSPATASDNARQEMMFENVMRATGLSRDAVVKLMVSDDELDRLCDSALSDFKDDPARARHIDHKDPQD
ncbi:hypothetical protein [Beijerinckia sp. L45]|uniref:hypothetical protein n=1 Tax=Beijerinckia sp. L45 TaxID=1641855 RepID=UPI001576F6E0|nr:hypothetical protein [Beijerinckia sp. L45]